MQRERERESYNLEDSFSFKYLFACLKEKNNVCLSFVDNAENLLTGKLYLKYRKQKVDVLEVRSIESKLKNLNDTS